FDKGGVVHSVAGFGSTPSVLISMAVGAILCFLAVAMLSTHVVQPLAQAIGVPLGAGIRASDWLGVQLVSVPKDGRRLSQTAFMLRRGVAFVAAFVPLAVALVRNHSSVTPVTIVGVVIAIAAVAWILVGRSAWPLARGWYVLRRVLSYVLACALFLLVGAAVAGILALIYKPLALLAGLVTVIVSVYAVYRIWRGTETEWPPEQA